MSVLEQEYGIGEEDLEGLEIVDGEDLDADYDGDDEFDDEEDLDGDETYDDEEDEEEDDDLIDLDDEFDEFGEEDAERGLGQGDD